MPGKNCLLSAFASATGSAVRTLFREDLNRASRALGIAVSRNGASIASLTKALQLKKMPYSFRKVASLKNAGFNKLLTMREGIHLVRIKAGTSTTEPSEWSDHFIVVNSWVKCIVDYDNKSCQVRRWSTTEETKKNANRLRRELGIIQVVEVHTIRVVLKQAPSRHR